MGRRQFNSIEDFTNNLHQGEISIVNFDGKPLPCIHIENQRYEEILAKVAGKKLAVDVLLDIFHDEKNVFVDINMTYQDYNIEENYLVYANDKKEFFQALATTGMIGLLPTNSSGANANIFMVQIPKLDAAQKAWEQINSIISKSNLK
jgi:hypothetical protein